MSVTIGTGLHHALVAPTIEQHPSLSGNECADAVSEVTSALVGFAAAHDTDHDVYWDHPQQHLTTW